MNEYSQHSLSGKDRKALIKSISGIVENAEDLLPKKGIFHKYKFSKYESLIIQGHKQVLLLEIKNRLIPSLKIARSINLSIPKIVVDLGAIKFVTNGADIMKPGITEIDDSVVEGDMVIVVEERKGSPLCFGLAMYDAVDMKAMDSGKCIKNLHYLKDKWFDFTP